MTNTTKQEQKEFEERFWKFCQRHKNEIFTEPETPLPEEIMKKFNETKKKLNIPELEEFLLK